MAHEIRSFASWDGLRISYQLWGEHRPGEIPVVLHHGFVASADANWVAPGIVDALLRAGRTVLAPDARGHGRSQAPRDPGRYGEDVMARDLQALVRESAAAQIDLVGYSMGAVVALLYAAGNAGVRRLLVGGVGSGIIECGGVDRRSVSNESIIEALEAPDGASVRGTAAGGFRMLADAIGNDRLALAAQARSVYRGGVELSKITAQTLVVAGEDDELARDPQVLADAIAGATLTIVPGDHTSALAQPQFTSAIIGFLR